MKHFKSEIEPLIDSFRVGKGVYLSASKYSEAQARMDFIDKFFIGLGWDVDNSQMLHPAKREVIVEQTNQKSQRPDYTFRVDGISVFHVEAKRPSVDITTNIDAIFQARRYGYTDEHPIVVLTNFRQLSIYDATIPVHEADEAETGLLFQSDYNRFVSDAAIIEQFLGHHNVGSDDWNKLVNKHVPAKYLRAGERFFNHLRQWRIELGSNIVQNHPTIPEDELNDFTQLILNRLLFIRMCEDRGLELEHELRDAAADDRLAVKQLFNKLDARYNTGLFEDSNAKNASLSLIDGDVLRKIVNRLYAPMSPFSYAILDADFLGRVYELSLAEKLSVIKNDDNKVDVVLESKDEYRMRDVVTTPQALVDAVVQRALKELPDSVNNPRVFDFATGSGRFLVSAYRNIVSKEIARRLDNKKFHTLVKTGINDFDLPFADKVKIVRKQLFGIDIDFNAVEVARFSILVSLLENETVETLPVGPGILPDLSENIIHGNSLVRPSMENPEWLDNPIYAIDLDSVGFNSFDLVIGNPPYVSTEDMKKINSTEFSIVEGAFSTLLRQWDKYFAFVELASQKLSKNGAIGVVIPNKWLTTVSAASLRELLDSEVYINWLQNFTYHPVFEKKQIYVCGLVAAKHQKKYIEYAEPSSIDGITDTTPMYRLERKSWIPAPASNPWVLPSNKEQEVVLRAIYKNSIPLGEIVEARNGLQTSANDVFVIKNAIDNRDGTVTFSTKIRGDKLKHSWVIEDSLLIPYLDDSKGINSFDYVESDAYLLFPYASDGSRLCGKSLISEEVMEKKYPKTYSYLSYCKDRLLKRDRGARRQMQDSGAFYAYGRGQALGYATASPKIFYSVNQRGDKYGLDCQGVAFQSGGTAGEVALFPLDYDYSLDYILGLLAQPEIELFLRKRGSPFRGGYFARGTDVISSVPVPKIDFARKEDVDFHDRVVDIVREIRSLVGASKVAGSRSKNIAERHIQQEKMRLSALFRDRWDI